MFLSLTLQPHLYHCWCCLLTKLQALHRHKSLGYLFYCFFMPSTKRNNPALPAKVFRKEPVILTMRLIMRKNLVFQLKSCRVQERKSLLLQPLSKCLNYSNKPLKCCRTNCKPQSQKYINPDCMETILGIMRGVPSNFSVIFSCKKCFDKYIF